MKKILYITTIPTTFKFLHGQIGHMLKNGYKVEGITGPGKEADAVQRLEQIPIHQVFVNRTISPIKDIFSLFKMFFMIKRICPDIMNTSTPKAAFLSLISARILRVPIIIYTLRGVRYEGETGLKKKLLMQMEKISCSLAHSVLATSYGSLEKVVGDGICSREKIKVLLSGTGNGINLEKFNIERFSPEDSLKLKKKYGIPKDNLCVIYIGRMVKEKGIIELIQAWKKLKEEYKNISLLVVGREEKHDAIGAENIAFLKNDESVFLLGFQNNDNIPEILFASDILVLPSYREGFGITPLEAGAMMTPSVVSDIPGLSESVQHNITGIRVRPKSPETLYEAIKELIGNEKKRNELGLNGKKRVETEFDSKLLWECLLEHYKNMENLK